MARPGLARRVGVERDAPAVRRPDRPRRLERTPGDLHGGTAGRGDDVDVIPAVAIAQERDPFAIGRRLRSGVPGDAPELVVGLLVQDGWLAAVDGDRRGRAPF